MSELKKYRAYEYTGDTLIYDPAAVDARLALMQARLVGEPPNCCGCTSFEYSDHKLDCLYYLRGKAHRWKCEYHKIEARCALMQRAVDWCLENGAHTSAKGIARLEEDGYSSLAEVPAELAAIICPGSGKGEA